MDVSFKTDENDCVEEITLYYRRAMRSINIIPHKGKRLHPDIFTAVLHGNGYAFRDEKQCNHICLMYGSGFPVCQIIFCRIDMQDRFTVPIEIAEPAIKTIIDRLKVDIYKLDTQKYTELKNEFEM